MQENKQYIHLTLSSCKIQNSRHEITKVIISSLIIRIQTILFHQTIFGIIEYIKKDDTFILHHYHAKSEMAAITKVIISSLIIKIQTILFHQTIFGIKEYIKKDDTFILHHYHAKSEMAAMKSLNHIFTIN